MSIINDINKIVEAGIRAPSGDNMQPWKCIFQKDETLEIYNIAGKDKSLYNFNEYGSYFSTGAFLENLSIAARHFGYEANIVLFPKREDENYVATIMFRSTAIPEDDNNKVLFEAIYKRSTNRKKYSTKLPEDNFDKYKSIVSKYHGCELLILSGKKEKLELSKVLALNERMMLENKYIHDALFGIIRWNEEEEKKECTGLYLKTLELNPVQRKMFNWFNDRKILDALLKLGIAKILPKVSSSLYRASGAICAITIPEDSKHSFVIAGRAFERLWLTLISEGISLQPTAGVTFLGKRIIHGQKEHLSEKHAKLIEEAYGKLVEIFNLKEREFAITFRIGKSQEPYTSRKLSVEKILIIE